MKHEKALDQLLSLGYLKYVEPSRHAAVRAQLLKSLQQGFFDTDCDDDCRYACRRLYFADSENLAEGQFGELLTEMKPVLRTEGVRIDSVEDDFTEEGYNVRIDGTLHVIWDRSEAAKGSVWALATKRCLEIVDGLLEKAGSRERVWGVYGGNDGRFILLTPDLHQVLADPGLGVDPDAIPYRSTDPRLHA